ncbi:hypothetical protein NQ176_g7171 [Zarea fungicola]|uniref:Uncharacterized protein n=1 Tax=Zarea fungicola TaxID=93591 RepID=A0ACC1MZI8_9HYPO|nr:hypothetical protein NQ176_g7171 [Lecanicillium fungicola]
MPAHGPPDEYDFIIVGAGPAGCALASTIATSAAAPNVLLIEAGGCNDDVRLRIAAHRHLHFKNPSLAWGYKSAPEENLHNRELDLDRGKGLGGSSAVNFMVWTEGPQDDMDRMAKLTGDSCWEWERVKERYARLTARDSDPDDARRNPGPLRLELLGADDPELDRLIRLFSANGVPILENTNDGSPLGIGIYPSTSYQGRRSIIQWHQCDGHHHS